MAAAFAALVSLENNLLLIYNHPKHSFQFEVKQIQSLGGSVSFLISFMKSHDKSHGATKQAAEALEMRIAHAAQVAEDVIESHMVDQIRGGKTRSSRFLLDLQKAIEGMDYMRRKTLNVRARHQQQQSTYSSAAVVAQSTPLTFTMVGFDDILLQLLDLLTGVPSSRRVIPIQGMGGTGKTTLARKAFQHKYIVEHFDVCLWATISQEYSLHKILSELLSHLRKSNSGTGTGTVDELQERLYKSLYGLRYLIVLDDMWNVKALEDILFLFPDTNNGSRIILTTRHSDIANALGVSPVAMSLLDEDNSWHLFCQIAFAEQQGCPPELEEAAMKIVAKCKGLPLAIVVIGGHLRKSSMALDNWEHVAESNLNDEQCLNVLSLSYNYLPVHLKPCFLFIGAFPVDCIIDAWDVVKLWIAEGFIQQGEYSSLEDAAWYCLWDLYLRNLILVDKWDQLGDIYTFKVHDLVREMCLKIAKEE